MNISTLQPALCAIRADGHINLEEANSLFAPKNGIDWTNKDTFSTLTTLKADIVAGNTLKAATPETVEGLNKKNTERLAYKGLNKGGLIGGGVGFGFLAASSIGIAVAVGVLGIPFAIFGIVPVLILAPVIAGIGAYIGKKVGQRKARKNPIEAAEVKKLTDRVLAAKDFKKNALVQRGIKISGILGGSVAGVLAIWGVTSSSVAMGSMGLLSAVLMGIPFIGIAGVAIAGLIGVGALGGYIHSRVNRSREEANPNAPITASPEALEVIDAAINECTP